MPTLIKNQGAAVDCTANNKGIIDNRVTETNTDLNAIREILENFRLKIESSSDPVIKNFSRATSFPVEDIRTLLNKDPECKYIRVYNGLISSDEYTTFLAPIDDVFQSLLNADSVLSQACCHCKPCLTDGLLYT